jgi:hypothetical protein
MLGLGRPRLKARPSLLDLISRREEQPTTIATPSVTADQSSPPPSPPELPPLPDSPTSTSSTTSTTFPVTTPSTQTSSTMAPAQDDSHAHGSVFSVSGPVVVAEHMIGCAMYELVSSPQHSSPGKLISASLPRGVARTDSNLPFSAMLVRICSLVKSFDSTATKPLFRSTKKLVRLLPLPATYAPHRGRLPTPATLTNCYACTMKYRWPDYRRSRCADRQASVC